MATRNSGSKSTKDVNTGADEENGNPDNVVDDNPEAGDGADEGTGADAGSDLAEKIEQRKKKVKARRSKTEKPNEWNGKGVPTIRVKILEGGGGCYYKIARETDGTRIMHSRQIVENPQTGERKTLLVVDSNGTLHRRKRPVKLHEGSEHTMHADDAAGLVFKGYAEIVEEHPHNQISTLEQLDRWVPKMLREHLERDLDTAVA